MDRWTGQPTLSNKSVNLWITLMVAFISINSLTEYRPELGLLHVTEVAVRIAGLEVG